MTKHEDPLPASCELVIYQSEDGRIRLETRLENEALWLTQQQMAQLFQTTKQSVSHHNRNIYEEGELTPDATVKNYLTAQREGTRDVQRKLDDFLRFNEREVLLYAREVRKKQADTKAHTEYALFSSRRRKQKEAVKGNEQFAQLRAAAKLIAAIKPEGKK